VTCEHGARQVTRTEWDGSVTVRADRYRGRRLNSPNDVVVRSDGSVSFTGPSYGIASDFEGHRARPELDGCCVFRLDTAAGDLAAADDLDRPNGLAFSPDESVLDVSDTGAGRAGGRPNPIDAYDVVDGRRPADWRVLAEVSPRAADGFPVDEDGDTWTSAGDGVHCVTPARTLPGTVRVPEKASSVTLGGRRETASSTPPPRRSPPSA
jgi:gluconolactonase